MGIVRFPASGAAEHRITIRAVPQATTPPSPSTAAGKLERIRQLAEHCLNTPRITLVEVGTQFDDALRDRLLAVAAGDELMTVRTYHPTDEVTFAKGPFAPEIPVAEAIRLAEEYSREWNVLFQEAIDVDETLLAGNFIVSPIGAGRYEALAGRYRVREVEEPPDSGAADLREGAFACPDEIADRAIREAVERVLDSDLLEAIGADADDRILLEFNVQSRPVGERREPLLFWEWRPISLRAPARARGGLARAAVRRHGDVVGVGVDGLRDPDALSGDLPDALGGKGAGLWRMFRAGLPVPPTVVLTVANGTAGGELPDSWGASLDTALQELAQAARSSIGDKRPSLLAVRSSPAVSMPGLLETVLGAEWDRDAVQQAVRRVLASWTSARAMAYREARAIRDDAGLAVVVQPMIFGDADDRSGSGVGFTRDPATGHALPVIEFGRRSAGPPVVGGEASTLTLSELESAFPALGRLLLGWARALEHLAGDVQEFEFAVESGRGFLLQTRTAKRSPEAAVRIGYELFKGGEISADRARELLAGVDIERLARRRLLLEGQEPVAEGRVAAPGLAVGRVALDVHAIERIRAEGDSAILVTDVPDPSDYPYMRKIAGAVSRRGGATSHATVLALEAGIVSVVGCRELVLESGAARFGEHRVETGDWLSVSAEDRGRVYAGRLEEGPAELPSSLNEEIVSWARSSLATRRTR